LATVPAAAPATAPAEPAPSPPAPSSRGALALTGAPMVIADHAASAPPGLAGGPTLSSLVQAIRRRWLLAFGIALLGGTSAVLAVLSLWPAKYAASARLQIASRGDPGIFAQTDHDEDFLTFKTNIAAALKSPLFLNTALKSDEAQKLALVRDNPGAAEWLSEALKTDFKGPGILEVRLGADNGGEVAALLNVVLREFIKDLRLKDASRRSAKTRELESSLAARKRKLDEKRSRLRTLENQGGFDDLETA